MQKKILIVKYHFQFQRHGVKANSSLGKKKLEEREKGSKKEIVMRQKNKSCYR